MNARSPQLKDLQWKTSASVRNVDRRLICAFYDILQLHDLQQQHDLKHATVHLLISPGSCVPLRILLNLPQQSTGQFRTADSFQRPDRAGGEYLVSSELQVNTIPSHNNPLSMNSGEHIIVQLLRTILPTSGATMLEILRRMHDIQKASANNDWMPHHGLLALKTSITKTDTRKTRVWAHDKKPVLDSKVMAITVPNHKNASARTIGANAAEIAGQPLDGSYMMLELPQAARSTYQMYKITNGADFVLLAHYPKFYLHFLLSAIQGICWGRDRDYYDDGETDGEWNQYDTIEMDVPVFLETKTMRCMCDATSVMARVEINEVCELKKRKKAQYSHQHVGRRAI
ncbi:MAG: hypothetical protein Q9175_006242 [Cornicularia normoerica]